MSISNYNKTLKSNARALRQASTPGEGKLWHEVLCSKRMMGYTFNRQFAIENYIVDFVCRKLKLVIEIDGYSHNFKHNSDISRDEKLEQLGYKVVRITEQQVMNDLQNVVRTIEVTINNLRE